jgi:hypothetical protein
MNGRYVLIYSVTPPVGAKPKNHNQKQKASEAENEDHPGAVANCVSHRDGVLFLRKYNLCGIDTALRRNYP